MKKVYLLVSGVLLTAGAVNAQMNKEVIKYDFTEEAGVTNVRPAMHSERAADDIIWEDNFDDPGLWIAEGPSADYDINGWSIGTATNSWWGGMEADMLTAGNFARFANGDAGDDDPAVIADGPFTLTYSETFDLSAVPAAHLEFEQYGARFITLQAIEVSTDGGATWQGNSNVLA